MTENADDIAKQEHAKWLSKYEKIKDLAEIIVAKNRNGPVGTILLHFDREHMVFSSYEPKNDPYNYTENTPIKQISSNNEINSININNQKQISPYVVNMTDDNDIDSELANIFK